MKTDTEAGLKLLVIDDESQNLGLIESALEQQELEIITAADPEVGFALFLEQRPQIVLLDLMMPKISGMSLLEKILATDPATEVILMTGYPSVPNAISAIRLGRRPM